MSANTGAPAEEVKALRAELDGDAEASGYHLNPDVELTEALAEGLLVNEKRFGYRSCPCRLASGDDASDLDIVCPCDYRDADLAEWGTCYCALYVSEEVLDGKRELTPIPDRRPSADERARAHEVAPSASEKRGEGRAAAGTVTVWRCRVCGYLCGREEPPERCPICKAQKERFELLWE